MIVTETIFYSVWHSPVGILTLAASERGLVALEFGDRSAARAGWVKSPEKLAPYRSELEEYFAGLRKQFTMPLDLRGTDFQMRCWRALLAIPYGETRSYAEIARAVGKPNAFRAVGMANHDNPIAIVVPCHRVITSAGTLGGYGGGLPLKSKLLELEKAGAVAQQAIGF
jgi:O-6-methylguanine DNA methyltransferase